MHRNLLLASLLVLPQFAFAQQIQEPPPPSANTPLSPAPPTTSYLPPSVATPSPGLTTPSPSATIAAADYVLGPFDQITVFIGEFEDQFGDKNFRVDGQGDVSLPLVGRLHAAGLTLHAFEESVKERLSPILKHPDVVVNVTEFASQTVSVLGSVNTPNVQKLVGASNLFNVLSNAGGLNDDAGTTVKITREARWGAIPWPNATVDPVAKISTATIHVKEIAQAGAESLTMMPGDTVFVPKADIVYAVGSVVKPGGFPIGQNETISALQVVSLAEGLQKTAAGDKAKILRSVPGSKSRIEIPVNIKLLMAGKTTDVPLKGDDILFIPNSGAKSAAGRTLDAIVASTGALIIYGSRF